MANDFATGISELAMKNDTSLIERILEVGGQHMVSKESLWQTVWPLKALTLRSNHRANWTGFLRGSSSYAHHEEYFAAEYILGDEYVALSYVWNYTKYEDTPKYSWRIKSESSNYRDSEVRDTVLNRVVQYMKQYNVEHLWVDRECIDQDDQEARRQAMQSMDLVYHISKHPLAVLSVPIRTRDELEALGDLLEGRLVGYIRKRKKGDNGCDLVLANHIDEYKAYSILDLLNRLTLDVWWTRAWCFQEEYVADSNMKFLIPHHLGQSIVANKKIFGKLMQHGDVVVSSFKFRMEATRFIFAYVATANRARRKFDRGICRKILDKAGKYTLMGRYGHLLDFEVQGRSMSTLVLSDLRHKSYTVPSDILNIAANCNVYSKTVNTVSLNKQRHSLSAAILAMWFANGEIFWNNGPADPNRRDSSWCADQNVFEYLNCIAFNAWPYLGEQGTLTYRRKFRLLRPKLTETGVETSGHLFRVSQIIEFEADEFEALSPKQVLHSVANRLLRNRHRRLAARLRRFIYEEFDPDDTHDVSPSRRAMSLSAVSLVSHLREKSYVAVGYLVNRGGIYSQGSVGAGIFAIGPQIPKSPQRYVFTCWQEGSRGITQYENQPEEDKCMFLNVSVVDWSLNTFSPLLRTEAWTDSLCFYEGAKQHPYTFPWPASLSNPHAIQETDSSGG